VSRESLDDAAFERRKLAAAPRRAGAGESQQVGDTLAAAFADDPVTSWMGRRDANRDHGRRAMFRYLTANFGVAGNELWTAADYSVAALWVPPERADLKQPLWQELKMFPTLISFVGLGGLSRVDAFRKSTEAHHPKADAHFYLMTIGVDPRFQGQGLGSAMLAANLTYIDTKRLPAYLESSSPKNVPLYRRHGFEVVSEFRVRADAPPLWGMWRKAR
jgi:ribosomal protein S18 acetylase RimI-like enzyme